MSATLQRRFVASLACLVACQSVEARGDEDEKEACIAAYESAQSAQHQGKLLGARRDYIRCAQDSCPPVLKKDCSDNLAKVDASIPTVVVRATKAGADVGTGKLFVDGKERSESLDGRALELDPGRHSFRYLDDAGHSRSVGLVVLEGRKNQLVEIELGAEKRPLETGTRSTPPYLAYGMGILGLAAIGSFAYFGLSGKAKERDLDDCAPLCEKSDYRAMHRDYLVADASLGLGIVLLGLSTYLFAVHESPRASSSVGVVPRRRGATASWLTAF